MSYEPDPSPPPSAARERVSMPGVFLAVIGGINILAAAYLLFSGYQSSQIDPKVFEKEILEKQVNPQQLQDLKKAGWTAEKLVSVSIMISYGWGAVALLCGLVSVLGGIRMVKLRS